MPPRLRTLSLRTSPASAGLRRAVHETPATRAPNRAWRVLLMPYREWLGPGFLLLGVIMLFASVGCFRRRRWGWWLAVGIFAVNGLADAGQLFLGHYLEGAIGVTVAAGIVFYLWRPKVQGAFT